MMDNFDRVKNYEKFRGFIIMDAKIKNEMVDMRPPLDTDKLSEKAIIEYADNFYDTLKYIVRMLKKMAAICDGENGLFVKRADELGKQWLSKFEKCPVNLDALRKFYQENVTNMSLEVIEGVKNECISHDIYHKIGPIYILKGCKTINELLHVFHTYLVNNDRIIKSLNVVGTKEISRYYLLTLRGKENAISKGIFDRFPQELDVGDTEIISFDDISKIFMMVHDRGHALTIEIDYLGDNVLINYFIPKICNPEIVNKLPGVRKVRENANSLDSTTGRFETTRENLCNDLFRFIEMVPMDSDIPKKPFVIPPARK